MACTLELVRAARARPGRRAGADPRVPLHRPQPAPTATCSRASAPPSSTRTATRVARRHRRPCGPSAGGARCSRPSAHDDCSPAPDRRRHEHRLHRPRQHGRADGRATSPPPATRSPASTSPASRSRASRPVASARRGRRAGATSSSPCCRTAPILRAVYAEIVPAAAPGTVLVDCSTVDVDSARAVAGRGRGRRPRGVDAPVSGGTGGAAAGTLTFMVGGAAEAFAGVRPLFEIMGARAVHCGAAGAGQAAKICNNMILGISMIAVCEAFALADKLGLDRAGAVRRGLDLLGRVLVGDHLLPRAGRRPQVARRTTTTPRLRRRSDAQGPPPRPAGRGGGRRADRLGAHAAGSTRPSSTAGQRPRLLRHAAVAAEKARR